jgi:hypothetical protein
MKVGLLMFSNSGTVSGATAGFSCKTWVGWMDEQTILLDSTASTKNLNSDFLVAVGSEMGYVLVFSGRTNDPENTESLNREFSVKRILLEFSLYLHS